MKWFVRGLAVCTLSSCFAPPEPAPPLPPASAGRFTIECAERGVRAYDATRTVIDGVPIDCTVHLALHDGTPAAGRKITVLAEAGRFTIEPATSAEGSAALRLETGMPLPLDVDPETFTENPLNDATHTGELVAPMWMMPYQWNENVLPSSSFSKREPRRPDPLRLKPDGSRFTNNPRDNLVTIMAWVEGEEAFVDVNANGTFDTGEEFTDLTEPFVDANDDGTRGSEEQFIDTNGNGQWDGKNGLWDARTNIWTQQRVLWTGLPAPEDFRLTVQGVTGQRPVLFVSPSTVSLRCLTAPMCSMAGSAASGSIGPVNVTAQISDPWFNRLAHQGQDDSCTLTGSSLVVVTPNRLPLPPADVWPATNFFFLTVGDARTGPTPTRSPPAAFTLNFECDLSPSPGRPAERYVFFTLQGSIE